VIPSPIAIDSWLHRKCRTLIVSSNSYTSKKTPSKCEKWNSPLETACAKSALTLETTTTTNIPSLCVKNQFKYQGCSKIYTNLKKKQELSRESVPYTAIASALSTKPICSSIFKQPNSTKR
jgi:hypothetical protein